MYPRPIGRFDTSCSIHFIHYMAFIRNTDSARIDTTGAAFSVEPGNPVHMLYAGAAVTAAATVVTCVGVTTVAAPALTLLPVAAAGGMAAAAHFINDRNVDSLIADGDAAYDATPVAV